MDNLLLNDKFLTYLEKQANGDEEEEAGPKPSEAKLHEITMDLFEENKSPTDEELHDKAEDEGVHPSHLEEHVYKMLGDTLKKEGQKHEDVPDEQFNQSELNKGIEVEQEHTDNPDEAKEIAKDHLSELPDYYTRLEKMEEEGKEEIKQAAAKLRTPSAKVLKAIRELGKKRSKRLTEQISEEFLTLPPKGYGGLGYKARIQKKAAFNGSKNKEEFNKDIDILRKRIIKEQKVFDESDKVEEKLFGDYGESGYREGGYRTRGILIGAPLGALAGGLGAYGLARLAKLPTSARIAGTVAGAGLGTIIGGRKGYSIGERIAEKRYETDPLRDRAANAINAVSDQEIKMIEKYDRSLLDKVLTDDYWEIGKKPIEKLKHLKKVGYALGKEKIAWSAHIQELGPSGGLVYHETSSNWALGPKFKKSGPEEMWTRQPEFYFALPERLKEKVKFSVTPKYEDVKGKKVRAGSYHDAEVEIPIEDVKEISKKHPEVLLDLRNAVDKEIEDRLEVGGPAGAGIGFLGGGLAGTTLGAILGARTKRPVLGGILGGAGGGLAGSLLGATVGGFAGSALGRASAKRLKKKMEEKFPEMAGMREEGY